MTDELDLEDLQAEIIMLLQRRREAKRTGSAEDAWECARDLEALLEREGEVAGRLLRTRTPAIDRAMREMDRIEALLDALGCPRRKDPKA